MEHPSNQYEELHVYNEPGAVYEEQLDFAESSEGIVMHIYSSLHLF